MQKCYIAAPYTSMSISIRGQSYGRILDLNYIKMLNEIARTIELCGIKAILPHRDNNNWGRTYIDPIKLVTTCFDQIKEADFLICIPEGSYGVHLEIGYAKCLQKKMIILLHPESKGNTMVQGLESDDIVFFRTNLDKNISSDILEALYQFKRTHIQTLDSIKNTHKL